LIRERLRGRLEAWLLRVWFDSPAAPATAADRLLAAIAAPVALPLSWLVAAIARHRRKQILHQAPAEATVPVVVVGNLVAGGSGKTPLVAAIALALREQGFRPGLLAGGYRSRAAGDGALLVDGASDPARAGDEAVLLALHTALPVAAGRNRAAAVALLERRHSDCDVIVSDDGLQHRGLARRIELLVIDDRGLGNGRCLPAGPLREPADRIASVDAVILASAGAFAPPGARRQFRSIVKPTRFRSLAGDREWEPSEFSRRFGNEPLTALAGIARPRRFFELLESLGLQAHCHPLPDHGRIDPGWLAALPGRWLLMTAKDAVKCRGFDDALRARCAYLEVAAMPEPALLKWLVSELGS
jgi:tetraacyldisaccharide 4'-kinase